MSNLPLAFLKAITIDEKFSYINDLEPRWFKGDDLEIFKVCAYLYLTKKHPSYEQVKGLIELAQDIKQYKRDDLIRRLNHIKDGLFILPLDDPIGLFRREFGLNAIDTAMTKIPTLTYDNKVQMIKDLADKLKIQVQDSNTFILQDEINKFADELATGEANDMSGSIDLSNHWERHEVLANQMQNWKKLLGAEFIMPKFYLFGARVGDFKTSLLIDLNIMLHRMNKRGLYLSFEDTKDDLRVKFISQLYNIDKKYLYSVKDDKKLAEQIKKPRDEKIIIHDTSFDYDKLLPTIEYYMAKYQIDYISMDYVQLFTGKAPIKDRLDVVAQDIMEVTRQYRVPFFCLTQISKNDTDKDAADSRLHKRHVKESKKLAETPRFIGMIYGDNHTSTRSFNRDKNTLGKCGELQIEFDGPTGCITNVWEQQQ